MKSSTPALAKVSLSQSRSFPAVHMTQVLRPLISSGERSKAWGKGGKPAFGFPCFPQDVISTALLLCCLCSFLLTIECPAESIGFGPGFQDVRPVCDAIEQCFAQSGIRDPLRPL